MWKFSFSLPTKNSNSGGVLPRYNSVMFWKFGSGISYFTSYFTLLLHLYFMINNFLCALGNNLFKTFEKKTTIFSGLVISMSLVLLVLLLLICYFFCNLFFKVKWSLKFFSSLSSILDMVGESGKNDAGSDGTYLGFDDKYLKSSLSLSSLLLSSLSSSLILSLL